MLLELADREFYEALPASAQLLLRQVELQSEALEKPDDLRRALLTAWIGWTAERNALALVLLPHGIHLELVAPTAFTPAAAAERTGG